MFVSDFPDNDGDKLIDWPSDSGCDGKTDNDEGPYNLPQCDDGTDNDGDGAIDYPADRQCVNRIDNNESS